MPPSTAPTTCCANACTAGRPRWSVKTPSAPTPQGSRPRRLMALPRDRRALRRLVPLVRRLNAEPVDGESPDTAAACSIRLRRKLPANHDLADVRAAELPAGRAGFCELREVAYGWERTSSRPRNRPGGLRCRGHACRAWSYQACWSAFRFVLLCMGHRRADLICNPLAPTR
jgi:hypothetical protein